MHVGECSSWVAAGDGPGSAPHRLLGRGGGVFQLGSYWGWTRQCTSASTVLVREGRGGGVDVGQYSSWGSYWGWGWVRLHACKGGCVLAENLHLEQGCISALAVGCCEESQVMDWTDSDP